jgi:L-amino acid N-acyltransferase YncA
LIRAAQSEDARQIAAIYNFHVHNTVVTFEEKTVSESAMSERIAEVQSAHLPWLVMEIDAGVVGYAYASKWKNRCAYRFSVEISVYVDAAFATQGSGSLLYAALLAQLRTLSIHAVMGGIALPNAASVGLHEKFGFKKVAHFKEAGFKQGRWVDIGYWQLIL